jgi:hypothetical protein
MVVSLNKQKAWPTIITVILAAMLLGSETVRAQGVI